MREHTGSGMKSMCGAAPSIDASPPRAGRTGSATIARPAASSTRIQCSLACYVMRASIPALIADYWTLAGPHRCTIRLVNAGSSCTRDRT